MNNLCSFQIAFIMKEIKNEGSKRRNNSCFDRLKNSQITNITHGHTHRQRDFLGFLSKPKKFS